MTTVQPIDDIIVWSDGKLALWQRDALRRLACGGSLTSDDHDELLAMVKTKTGLAVTAPPPEPDPLTKSHFSGAVESGSLKLKGVKEVKNVNRLATGASLEFATDGLTVIYGRNGSGKSGFVRILRTACRTRVENTAKLRVLHNVYGPPPGPQSANIVVEDAGVERILAWDPTTKPAPELLQVAVFDTQAAALYVDQGNQIQFLPFGLAMPHKLNALCLNLKAKLQAEQTDIKIKLELAIVPFAPESATRARKFYSELSGKTTDETIALATKFAQEDENRLAEVSGQLKADAGSTADLGALAGWIETCATECMHLVQHFSDERLSTLSELAADAKRKRDAAGLDAATLFASDPLPGVGSEVWRQLWYAARDYSTSEAYVGAAFPVLVTDSAEAACVLCQQPLTASASDRLTRFENYVSSALSREADKAELAVESARDALPTLTTLEGADWSARIKQLDVRNATLATSLNTFKATIVTRRDSATAMLSGYNLNEALTAATSPAPDLIALASALRAEVKSRADAGEELVRQELLTEQSELTDRKLLSANVAQIKARRDLLHESERYDAAIKEVSTTAITSAANALVDKHLSTQVIDRFDAERKDLEIDHLQISLSRKSGQTEAMFATKSGTDITKNASDILSEGEQRALALSAFLTEVVMTEGKGPIVVDDPVSSLDRERGNRVARRLANEAASRQVIVFTHDLIFFNDLCREAEALGQNPKTGALFAVKGSDAGKVDPAGVVWKGLPVKKRIVLLQEEAKATKTLYGQSEGKYERAVKAFYVELRHTYERAVEECIFKDIVTRGADRIETLKLRYIHLSDALAVRFYEGMTKANTFSHDNPATETVEVPMPAELDADLASFEKLVADIAAECNATEQRRPSMKK